MGLKVILLFVYALISVALFVTFDGDIDVWFSFLLSALVLAGITVYHIFVERVYSPFMSAFIVFTFLFFIVAPMVQINSFEGMNPTFKNKFIYDKDLAIFSNGLIVLFNVIFFFAYLFFKKSKRMAYVPVFKESSKKTTPVLIVVIAIVTILVFLGSYSFVIDELGRPAWRPSAFSVVTFLIWKKVFFLLPFAGIILCFQYFRKKNKKAVNLVTICAVFLFLGLLLLWFKNPLVEKRNALGPLYISLLFLAIPKLFNTNIKSLFFLFFTMIVAFPLSAILTHSEASFKEILEQPSIIFDHMKGGGIASAFNTLNYDAFSNIMATMDYVKEYGFSMGHQLLSAFLFFVPRGLWKEKPLSTGELVGNHLIDTYDFTYSNLSNPLVSEGFINFGVVGVIIAPILLAIVLVRAVAWLQSDDYLKKMIAFYLAIHLIFLLRGDFTNGYTYYIGAFLGVVIIPKFIRTLLEFFMYKQKVWKQTKALQE
ncbi:O-antigen polysaccharide polymerase Wzy [uncultured Dokdonia sp.]|uniref:O-antigen polysaccharide polymerase Wzy n=1 Tax=uncultured Dokdonia sp. TaxID=575653 RepID=UPI002630BD02|nr:O-antigen polysaccharide polymerase Wzy [uncultured Dokdonia sp.]